MDHSFIDDQNAAERYLKGQLSSEESKRFEEHFIDCTQCIERLETIAQLRDGLKSAAVALPRVVAINERVKPGKPRWRTVSAVAAMLLLAAFAGWFRYQDWILSSQLQQSQLASRGWETRVNALESQLRDRASQVPTPPAAVYSLDAMRSSGSRGSPVQTLRIPSSPAILVILINQEPVPEITSYRAKLQNAAGEEVARFEDLRHQGGAALAVTMTSSQLPAGTYQLALEGLMGAARYTPVGRFDFRVAVQ